MAFKRDSASTLVNFSSMAAIGRWNHRIAASIF